VGTSWPPPLHTPHRLPRRHWPPIPHLQYLDVLFGDETALPPPERFYQRLLSSNNREARALLDGLFAAKPKEQVLTKTCT
jgi:hypothetical protein